MLADCVYQWQRANSYAAKSTELANQYVATDASTEAKLWQASEMTSLALKYMKDAIACVNWSATHVPPHSHPYGGGSVPGGQPPTMMPYPTAYPSPV